MPFSGRNPTVFESCCWSVLSFRHLAGLPPSSKKTGFHLLTQKTDRFDLRKHIEFETRIAGAKYSDIENAWTITTSNGFSTTCRYFLPATGILSIPKEANFAGLKSYIGELYRPSNWPAHKVDFHGKRIAIVGTGSTGVHLVPKLAHVAKELTVFQRTPNYVLPGRNYAIDEYQTIDVKKNHDAIWESASMNPIGHACKSAGRTVKGVANADRIRQIFDQGWEGGAFNFSLETFDDIFMDPDSNEQAGEYIRQKIRALVRDPETAELLCPKYPMGSKRAPCGNFYYESFNRPNVRLVDISRDDIEFYEKGIRTGSGTAYELDMIILALGFDAGTGALNEMEVRGSQDRSLRAYWTERLRTFAGILVSGFPNMFMVCGPHMPVGNQPVILEVAANWIGQTIRHMEKNSLTRINATEKAVNAWSDHTDELWNSGFLSKPAEKLRSWFVGTNIPGKPSQIQFYVGGVQGWKSWFDSEINTAWVSMDFNPSAMTDKAVKDTSDQTTSIGEVFVRAETLESVVLPLQSDELGISPAEKFNLVTAASARYIDWAVKEIHDRGLKVKDDYRTHWWRVMCEFVNSESGLALIRQGPNTKDELDQLASKWGVEGEAITRIGPQLVRMLTGQANPLFEILRDNLLFRIYLSDESARPNRYIADYTKLLTSQRKDLRILEVGAGTGGTTFQVLQACSPEGVSFCSEYIYTDISNGFFKTGQSTLKKWERLLTFKTFNVENDVIQQGFEEHAYDLVIAANVVHATRSLTKSLGTIHKLLKPGGVLGLVELTKLTPYYNMIFGSLSGWWAGIDDGRTDSPLQSSTQWDKQLRSAGFSGVDLAAYDFPEPERHSALLLSTALPSSLTTNGRCKSPRGLRDSGPGIPHKVEIEGRTIDNRVNQKAEMV